MKTCLKPIICYVGLEKITHLESVNVPNIANELHSLPNMDQFMKNIRLLKYISNRESTCSILEIPYIIIWFIWNIFHSFIYLFISQKPVES